MVEHFTRNEVVASSILASSSKSESLVNAVISSIYKAFYISLIMEKGVTIGLIWHELAYEVLHPMLHLAADESINLITSKKYTPVRVLLLCVYHIPAIIKTI